MDYDNYKTPYYEEQATFSSQSLNKIQEMEPVEKLQFLKQVNTQVNELTDKIKSFEDSKAQAIKDAQKEVEDTQNKTQSAKENASE
jgi:gas vesicle protein